jgi:hypothetical protein
LYKEAHDILKNKLASREYFQGHCQSSRKFIGEQKQDNPEEMISLITYLTRKYPSVLLISEEYCTDSDFVTKLPKRSKVVSLSECKDILNSIPSFSKYIDSIMESTA